ncbi:hypothetical protein AWENTII_009007 [Aspergillus wentii]
MAAYEGNVDRYARLMRQSMTWTGLLCVVRGIYHHTMFARWWADQLETNPRRLILSGKPSSDQDLIWRISTAINARRIMINDITGFNNDTNYLPYLIWWPLKPDRNSLSKLAEDCPKMKEQIAIACIFCDYEWQYRKLDANSNMRLAAQNCSNPFYLADVERRAAEQGIDITLGHRDWDGETDAVATDLEPTTESLYAPLHAGLMDDNGNLCGTYFAQMPESGLVERYVWQSQERLRKIECLHGGIWEGPTHDLDEDQLPEGSI